RHARRQPAIDTTTYPYTTLFRSAKGNVSSGDGGALLVRLGDHRSLEHGRMCDHRFLHFSRRYPHAGALEEIVAASLEPVEAFLIDRKSTRLNSSHVAISYAVFCL